MQICCVVQDNIILDCEGRPRTAASVTEARTLAPNLVNMSVAITLQPRACVFML